MTIGNINESLKWAFIDVIDSWKLTEDDRYRKYKVEIIRCGLRNDFEEFLTKNQKYKGELEISRNIKRKVFYNRGKVINSILLFDNSSTYHWSTHKKENTFFRKAHLIKVGIDIYTDKQLWTQDEWFDTILCATGKIETLLNEIANNCRVKIINSVFSISRTWYCIEAWYLIIEENEVHRYPECLL